jgi:hypothetical protein
MQSLHSDLLAPIRDKMGDFDQKLSKVTRGKGVSNAENDFLRTSLDDLGERVQSRNIEGHFNSPGTEIKQAMQLHDKHIPARGEYLANRLSGVHPSNAIYQGTGAWPKCPTIATSDGIKGTHYQEKTATDYDGRIKGSDWRIKHEEETQSYKKGTLPSNKKGTPPSKQKGKSTIPI